VEQTLESLARYVKGKVIGNGAIRISRLNSLDAVQEGELAFVADARRMPEALRSKAAALIVGADVTDLPGRAGISVENPKLAFALLLDLFHPRAAAEGVIHPTAVIAKDAQLGAQVDIRAHAVIGKRARIGSGTIIEPGTFIGDNVTIGERCLLGPNVVIYKETIIGNRVMIHGGSVIGGDGFGYVFDKDRYVKVPQVGNVVIEDDVEIGCNSCVDRATIGSTLIERGTKLDNHVQVAHNNRIGKHVILAGQVGLAGSVTIGAYSMLGGKSGVIDHLTIGERARLGASSTVTKNVPPGESYWGFPARPLQQAKRQLTGITKLPDLMRTVAKMLVRLGRIEEKLEEFEQKLPRSGS
jgi:UDP-3-O-[3-hydroxymyristoyl] glucosamine N-acyltransferase